MITGSRPALPHGLTALENILDPSLRIRTKKVDSALVTTIAAGPSKEGGVHTAGDATPSTVAGEDDDGYVPDNRKCITCPRVASSQDPTKKAMRQTCFMWESV